MPKGSNADKQKLSDTGQYSESIVLERMGRALTNFRNSRRFTREALAKALSLKAVTYTTYENGRSHLPYSVLKKMKDMFGVEYDEIIDGTYGLFPKGVMGEFASYAVAEGNGLKARLFTLFNNIEQVVTTPEELEEFEVAAEMFCNHMMYKKYPGRTPRFEQDAYFKKSSVHSKESEV